MIDMFKIPEDIQQQMQEAANASKRQQEDRDHILSQILAQLDELNQQMFLLFNEVMDIAASLDGLCIPVGDDGDDDNAE